MTYLSINQVASELGVNRVTVRAWIRSGRLPAVRFGPRLIRIDQASLEHMGRPIPTREHRG